MAFRKEFHKEPRWGILISWIQHMEWYVPWHLFLNLCKNIPLYLFQCCGEKGHFSVVWYSDKYKLKIVVVIKNNWHFWTLLILGIWVLAMSQKTAMLKTALISEEQARIFDVAVKLLRCSGDCFPFIPPWPDWSQ